MTHQRRSENEHLDRLRGWRVYPGRARAIGDFLPDQFKKQIAQPHKQVAKISAAWEELVPTHLRDHTRLDGFSRGTLRVIIDSAAHRYELDRLLRSGLERQLISRVGGQLRKIRLSQSPLDQIKPDAGRAPASPADEVIDDPDESL